MSTTGSFHARCGFAARYILAGRTGSRGFDNCFEMLDGDAVVTALLRRAIKRAASGRSDLLDAIKKMNGGTLPESWKDAAERHRDERNLSALSRRLIAEANTQLHAP